MVGDGQHQFLKTAQCPTKASFLMGLIFLSLREEAVKHPLILSSDRTMEHNFAKLCALKFFLLDVSLSFTTGHKAFALFARDRPKKNYVLCYLLKTLYLKYSCTPYALGDR